MIICKLMYAVSLLTLAIALLIVRLIFLDWYPFGFSSHAITHATTRHQIYETLFIQSWNEHTWTTVADLILYQQHGPQSFVEALLTPVFGFGFTESRLIVSTLGLLSLVFIVAWGTVGLNRWFGLVAGIAIGTTPYALFFSRDGDSEHVNIYLQGFLLLFAAQRTIKRGYIRDYALLGLAAGLSLYVYATNQMLGVMVVSLVALFQVRPLFQSGWKNLAGRALAFFLAFFTIAAPIIQHHLTTGRVIPIRTPYGTPNYEFSHVHEIPSRFLKLWNELFVHGGDPWFARPNGALTDYTLLLLGPGIITMGFLLRRGNGAQSRSFYFLCAITFALVIFGGFPATLSPEPAFRRAILLALGLDILKTFGCYGIALFILRYTPKVIAYAMISSLMIGYGAYNWNSFLSDCSAYESNHGNVPVVTARYVREMATHGQQVVVFLPSCQGCLLKEDFTFYLNHQLGYPRSIPRSIKLIDPSDLALAPMRNVIVPFPSYERLSSASVSLPHGVTASNPRIFSNRMGSTFVVVDFLRESPPSPSTHPPVLEHPQGD